MPVEAQVFPARSIAERLDAFPELLPLVGTLTQAAQGEHALQRDPPAFHAAAAHALFDDVFTGRLRDSAPDGQQGSKAPLGLPEPTPASSREGSPMVKVRRLRPFGAGVTRRALRVIISVIGTEVRLEQISIQLIQKIGYQAAVTPRYQGFAPQYQHRVVRKTSPPVNLPQQKAR